MINKIFLFLSLFVNLSSEYAINSLFNKWNCIAIKDKIDTNIPYKVNIGDLSLILLKNDTRFYSTYSKCKHLGYDLNNGYIKNGCLVCPNHGLKYSENEKIGSTIEYQGKIFWSYKPDKLLPYTIPFYNNLKKIYMEIDMDCSLKESTFYLLDFKNSQLKFLNNYYNNNYKEFYNKDNSIGLLLEICLNKKNISTYYKFNYPNNILQKINIDKNNNLIISIDLLPISKKKTKWFVTILHNNKNNDYTEKMIKNNLIKDKNNLLNYSYFNEHINHLNKINNMFNNYYIYPTIFSSIFLYKDFAKIYTSL